MKNELWILLEDQMRPFHHRSRIKISTRTKMISKRTLQRIEIHCTAQCVETVSTMHTLRTRHAHVRKFRQDKKRAHSSFLALVCSQHPRGFEGACVSFPCLYFCFSFHCGTAHAFWKNKRPLNNTVRKDS